MAEKVQQRIDEYGDTCYGVELQMEVVGIGLHFWGQISGIKLYLLQ